MKKGKATIKVDFLAGTSIRDTVVEAREIATRLNLAYVKFNFNGIEMSIGQNADLGQVMEDLDEAMSSEEPFDKYVIRS